MDYSLASNTPSLSVLDAPLTGSREIERVRQEIRALDETVARLLLERKRLLTMISPVHRVPLELIGEIFVLTLVQHLHAPTIQGMNQLIDLCLVCRRWRAVALATPQLWSALALAAPFTPFACNLAASWLERSKAIPKSLFIDSSVCCGSEQCRHREDCALERMPLVKLLTEGPGPLRHLSFICARSLCLQNFQVLLAQDQQSRDWRPWDTVTTFTLETLEYWNHYQDTDEIYDEERSDYPILEHLPLSVTRLALHIADLPESEGADEDSLYILKLPQSVLDRLTYFTFTCCMNATTILEVLRSCNHVQVLCLDLVGMPWSEPDESSLNLDKDGDLLPALRNLRIQNCRFGAVQYLRAFRTPHLQMLDIEFANFPPEARGEDPPFTEILEEYFERSKCSSTLTHLRLHHAHLRLCYPVLAKLTSLTHLALTSMSPSSSTLFHTLSTCHMQDKPLPALESLSLTNFPDNLFDFTVWGWLEARRSTGMDIPHITVTQRCGQVREVDLSCLYSGEDCTMEDDRRWKDGGKCNGYRGQSDWWSDGVPFLSAVDGNVYL